jgi:prepilin-type N-terminal cleavage/methylation domain-containing protein
MRWQAVGPPGFSLVELLAVIAIITTMAAATIPGVLAAIDDERTYGAAWYVSTRLQRARMDAVAQSRMVAMRIVQIGTTYELSMYADGNGNGVRTADIQRGIDRQLMPPERLPWLFSGVDFGVMPNLPPVDPSGTAPGTDPIKLGPGNLVSFAAAGTSTSGSLYIRGRRSAQYVVRIFGETGKTRVLKFDSRVRRWIPL